VTLNVLEKHYMDRDLTRTGNSIVMVSPSAGVVEVDSTLSGITKQRMMDNGIGMDMLSLAQPPLHTVPLFICNDKIRVRDWIGLLVGSHQSNPFSPHTHTLT
jgi:hypothetical protein